MTDTIEHVDEQKPGSAGESNEVGALKALWDLFSSMKTAIVLLLVLAAVSIAITVLRPAEEGMQLFSSRGYVFLLTLIGINLTVCSINRFRQAWRRSFAPSLRADPKQLKNAGASVSLVTEDYSIEEAAEKAEKALRARRYAVAKADQDGAVTMHASKGRLAIWGPYLTHLSILVIFAGAVFGSRTGFDGFMEVTEGKTSNVFSNQTANDQKELDFELGLTKFTIEYDEETRNPIRYLSNLQVYDNGEQVASQLIDVNRPLRYNGITFYQSYYGVREVVMKVTAPDGESASVPFAVRTGNDPETGTPVYLVDGTPYETVTIGGKKLTLFVHNIAPDYIGGERINFSFMPLNPAVQVYVNEHFSERREIKDWQVLGWLPVDESADYKGYTISLERVVQFTGLSVARNPGLPVIYLGFCLLVLGIFLSFYLTHKVIRVHIARSGNRVNVTAGATSQADPSTFAKDLGRLRSEVLPAES